MSKQVPGKCNRCNGDKQNVLGLCEHCNRFPKTTRKIPFNMVRRIDHRDFKY